MLLMKILILTLIFVLFNPVPIGGGNYASINRSFKIRIIVDVCLIILIFGIAFIYCNGL